MFDLTTAREALEAWDAGELVSTLEMGGLGPGYEQAIHILAFELIRGNLDKALPSPDDWPPDWGDDIVREVDKEYRFSGAQVGAAKQLAAKGLLYGWRATLDSAPVERRIIVSKKFP